MHHHSLNIFELVLSDMFDQCVFATTIHTFNNNDHKFSSINKTRDGVIIHHPISCAMLFKITCLDIHRRDVCNLRNILLIGLDYAQLHP